MRKTDTLKTLGFLLVSAAAFGQQVPSTEENFTHLVTFGKQADKSHGDDDFSQVLFFVVPESQKQPIYIRVFDPDCGGKNDELVGKGDTKTKFIVLGGKGAHSNKDAQKQDPVGEYKSGTELYAKTIGADAKLDDTWMTIGPFNPSSGELQKEMGGYVFKLVVDGASGESGNLYKLFLSTSAKSNNAVEGGNVFTYEYCVRMADKKTTVAHLYPFISQSVLKVKISIFDYDSDGVIRLVSVAKKGTPVKTSGNNEWKKHEYAVSASEKNTSLDVQFHKQSDSKNNNIVVNITNQYDESMPFYTSPIGGVPKYKSKIGVKVD
jgi:hypothetical protein